MMGTTTLAEIRAELKASFAKRFKNPVKWLNQEIRRLKRKSRRSEAEFLSHFRDTLFKNHRDLNNLPAASLVEKPIPAKERHKKPKKPTKDRVLQELEYIFSALKQELAREAASISETLPKEKRAKKSKITKAKIPARSN